MFLAHVDDWMVRTARIFCRTHRQRGDFIICDEMLPHYKNHIESYNALTMTGRCSILSRTTSTCGLGNLATIYRQRRDLVRCDEVMIHYKFIIVTYNIMIALRKAARLSDLQELNCVRDLTFKYHKIAAYLACALQCTTGMAESYRNLMQYEFETGVAYTPDDEYAWMLTDILHKPRTLQALQGTTDQELMKCCEYIHE